MNTSSWLPDPGFEGLATRSRLICCAHAGGGPAAFADWATALPRSVSLCPLRRPGCDPPQQAPQQPPQRADVHILAHQAVEALCTLATRPSILFGHSLGAVIAFEIARLLDARGLPPRLLIDAAKLDGWQELTCAGVQRMEFDGGHFFPFERASGFLAWLGQRLQRA
ncbi:Thioesterase [Enhygromyxa salina]|uniref:Thioesterase n=1 Tax=Enhygromyxa salina TaxID=215803 RepID=A0A0C2D8I9_9BACT|nr:thioesterase domain-containing protein [Enhygromyxa salina]KIG19421.1 Thioesterase [Enhygromyxa salina]